MPQHMFKTQWRHCVPYPAIINLPFGTVKAAVDDLSPIKNFKTNFIFLPHCQIKPQRSVSEATVQQSFRHKQEYIYIYIYAFSRRFYPKRLTLHSSYSFTFDQLLLSLGIEPMILALLTPCSTSWATGKLQSQGILGSETWHMPILHSRETAHSFISFHSSHMPQALPVTVWNHSSRGQFYLILPLKSAHLMLYSVN